MNTEAMQKFAFGMRQTVASFKGSDGMSIFAKNEIT